MINPYQCIVDYEGDDDSFDEYLQEVHIFSIFEGLLTEFSEKKIFKGVVRYIVWAYSPESNMLLLNGETFEKTSDRIFKKTGLPNDLYDAVALIKSEIVQAAIQRWLKFLNEEEYTNYVHFRDLRREMLASSIGSIVKSTSEQDYEQKMKNAVHARELLEMMKEALQKYIQNSPKMKKGMNYFDNVIVTKNTASVEDFLNHKAGR